MASESGRAAVLAGASGLIGGFVLKELLASERYARVTALVRRPLEATHPKLAALVTDFSAAGLSEALRGAEDVFSCLGTTRHKVRTTGEYRAVDYDLALTLARQARERGAKRFLIVSTAGADPASSYFYPHLKGLIDQDVARVPFEAVHIFRPSLLLGARAELRPGELLARKAAPLYSWLCVGPLRRYKPVRAETVAKAMVAAALSDRTGVHIHEYDSMEALAA